MLASAVEVQRRASVRVVVGAASLINVNFLSCFAMSFPLSLHPIAFALLQIRASACIDAFTLCSTCAHDSLGAFIGVFSAIDGARSQGRFHPSQHVRHEYTVMKGTYIVVL